MSEPPATRDAWRPAGPEAHTEITGRSRIGLRAAAQCLVNGC
jgi:hypothetical protein